MKRRITLKDIALKAEVTVACVSLALRDSPQIASATKVRIRDLAEKLGYRPAPRSLHWLAQCAGCWMERVNFLFVKNIF